MYAVVQRGFALLSLVVAVGLGSTTVQSDTSAGAGPGFGRHVSDMAPEHPMEHGAEFGQCVSLMARTGLCPHHELG
jgi:hypothetical protein